MKHILFGWALAVLLILTGCSGAKNSAVDGPVPPSEPVPVDPKAYPAVRPQSAGSEVGIRHGSSKPRMLGTMAYECDDSTLVVAQLNDETGGLWVFLPEGTALLPHVPSASGAHYSDGAISVWSKGAAATIEVAGKSRHCTENRRRSVIEDAKLRGNDFWATGNEPGWTLEIGPKFTVLRTSYGQTIYTLRTPKPTTIEEARRTTYEGRVEGADVRIVIEGNGCNDSTSGELFESSVVITLRDETLYGCGQALH